MEINPTGKVTYISSDQYTLQTLASLLEPVTSHCSEKITIYIFSEKNIQDFITSFCHLFVGGPSIILVDERFKRFLSSLLLRVTSEVLILNEPVESIVNCIDKALESKKVKNQRDFNDDVFNLMGMLYHLNEREREVLSMILQGGNQSEIADKLNITPKIVSSSKLSAMGKMGMNTLVEVQAFLKLYGMLIQRQGKYLFN